MKGLKIVSALAVLLIGIALYMVFLVAPTEEVMGDVQRIFYFHVSAAWVSFLAFAVVFVGSVVYLSGKAKKPFQWDALAASSAELGILFCTIVIVTGPIWGKAAWGAWWTWDPRLTTTLILWFIYVAYLMLRGVVEEETRRGRFSAVLGIVGFIDVPIVFLAIRWWRTIHPGVFIAKKGEEAGLDPSMLPPFLISLAAFTVLYVALLGFRFFLEKDLHQLRDLRHRLLED